MASEEDSYEEQFKSLRAPFPAWVAIRAAMRVLPTIGVKGDFSFWGTDAAKYVDAIARLPYLAALLQYQRLTPAEVLWGGDVDSLVVHLKILARAAADDVRGLAPPPAASFAARVSALSAFVADGDAAHYSARNVVDGAIVAFYDAVGFDARAVAIAATRADIVLLPEAPPNDAAVWSDFFARPLWSTSRERIHDPWQLGVTGFRVALKSVGLTEIWDRYVRHCTERIDWNEVRDWLFEEHRPGPSDPPSDIPSLSAEERAQLQSADWWSELLYWLVLDNRRHMHLLEQPSHSSVMETLRTTSQTDSSPPSTSVFPNRVVQLRQQLAQQYESVATISRLWRVWFETVHGETLLEVGRELMESVSHQQGQSR